MKHPFISNNTRIVQKFPLRMHIHAGGDVHTKI